MNKLKLYLRLNAAFSFLSGLLLLTLSKPIAFLFGIKNAYILMGIGGGLVLFAISLVKESRRSQPKRSQVYTIVILDWGWVVLSAILIALQLFELTAVAYYTMAAAALVVAFFAIQQYRYRPQK